MELVSWSFLCYPMYMLESDRKIFHITCNLNVTIIGTGNILRDFLLAKLHWEADFLQNHILQCGKLLVAWRSWVLCSFPFFFLISAWKHRDLAIYQRVSDRVATWTWTFVIQVECLRGWLFWLTVTLDFFGHQFLEPDLLTSEQLLDLCLAYTICLAFEISDEKFVLIRP